MTLSSTPSSAPGGAGDVFHEPLEGELARFFGYSHDVLVILDGGGRVLLVSPSVERVLGLPIERLQGERLLRHVHPEDQPFVKAQARALMEGRAIVDLDVRVGRADGAWVPMRWSFAVGAHRRIYGVGRDRSDEVRHRLVRLSQEMAELRLTTAMELHDGILQTLTGASFQIAVARRLIRQDPVAAEEVLAALAKSVSAEQQEMRLYVDEVKGRSPALADGSLGLEDRIRGMLERVGVIWGLKAVPEVRLPDGLPAETARQVLRMVQEATVNAARHGGALTVSVKAGVDGHEIVVRVEDDGHGFSFLGEYDTAALKEKRLGPLSLKRRVESAGGDIYIRSTRRGSTVVVRIPLPTRDGA